MKKRFCIGRFLRNSMKISVSGLIPELTLKASTRLDFPSDPWTGILHLEVKDTMVLSRGRNVGGNIHRAFLDRARCSVEFVVGIFLRVVAKQPVGERHRQRLRVLSRLLPVGLVPDLSSFFADLLRQGCSGIPSKVSSSADSCRVKGALRWTYLNFSHVRNARGTLSLPASSRQMAIVAPSSTACPAP